MSCFGFFQTGSFEKVHAVVGFIPGEKTTYITAVPMRNKVTRPCMAAGNVLTATCFGVVISCVIWASCR